MTKQNPRHALGEQDIDLFRNELNDLKRTLLRRLGKIGVHLLPQDEPLDADWPEQAQQLENEEVLSALDTSGRRELDQIHDALRRMDSGVYGVCSDCDERIALKRLKALPFATRCIACANALEG